MSAKWREHRYGGGEGVTLGRLIPISVSWSSVAPSGYVVQIGDLRSRDDVRFRTTDEAKAWALRVARRQLVQALEDLAELEAAVKKESP